MGTYIHFTDEQKERANSVDLEEFLRQRGEKLSRAGRESRLARVHHITVRGNEWYDHIARQGGHAVSFVQHYGMTSYQEAMKLLLGNELGATYPAAEPKREEPPKPFALPPPHRYAPCVRLPDETAARQPGGGHPLCPGRPAVRGCSIPQLHLCGDGRAGRPRHAHKREHKQPGQVFPRSTWKAADPSTASTTWDRTACFMCSRPRLIC